MTLLRPLLLDAVPTVQQTAALALGRLANHSDDLAEAVVKGDILPQLVHSLANQNVCVSKIYYIRVERERERDLRGASATVSPLNKEGV